MSALLVEPSDWPVEPSSPKPVQPDRFARALREICGWMPPRRAESYAEWMLRYATEFGEDPFVLGALAFRMSRCRAHAEDLDGLGLTLLPPRMYADGLRSRVYTYRILDAGSWKEQKLALPRFAFIAGTLLRAESHLYFASALLSMWRRQHKSVDAAFDQAPHRHYLSHYVWGDRVRSARAEDRILTDRRRLLYYYGATKSAPPLRRHGMELGSPLDGAPRVVSSGLGSPRAGGRKHRGVDVESALGEPVRAIADGRVVFAGVDLPGRHQNRILAPEQINTFDRRALGIGGRYICILHGDLDQDGLRSCYMHLERIEVAAGARVERGQRVGSVGRTGMKSSSPHLHLEIRGREGLLDPLQVLQGLLIGRPQDIPVSKGSRRSRSGAASRRRPARPPAGPAPRGAGSK
jgi:murein DD-endopeptidase MepM/ murein hydrolase activator NlpD